MDWLARVVISPFPFVNLAEEALHGRHPERIKFLHLLGVDRYADAAGAGVDNEGAFQQVIELLTDFNVEPRVGVLENNILLRLE